tara:strand:+ start:395 stop:607 length:213 start_codon:yes stop_codon:yes gene_type:complete
VKRGKVKVNKNTSEDLDFRSYKIQSDNTRIDLNDLLERAKKEKKRDKKTNLLIFSGVLGVSAVVVLLLSL